MIETMKRLQKHNAELVEENLKLKNEREAILRILDADRYAEPENLPEPPKCNMRTLAEALEENPIFPFIVNGSYGTFKSTETKEPASVSMSMKFNLLNALYAKTQRENTFTKDEICFIKTLAKEAIKNVTDEHYKDLLKIVENQTWE